MKPSLRHSLPAAVLLCLLAATAGAQFIEDSAFLGTGWVFSLSHNAESQVVYAVCMDGGRCLAVDCRTLDVYGGAVAPGAIAVEYIPPHHKAYCSFGGSGAESLMVIEGYGHHRVSAFPVPGASFLVYDPDVDRLYASCGEFNDVAVVDCQNDSVIARIHVGAYPLGMTLNRQHRKLYVRNSDGESVSIIDLGSNQLIRTYPVGNVPESGHYLESADRYYCGASPYVWVFDGAGDTVVDVVQFAIGTSLPAMEGIEALNLLLVAGYGTGDSVYTIDAVRDSITHAVQVRGSPSDLLWSPGSGLVYCASGYGVWALAGDGSRIDTMLAVPGQPFVLVAVPEVSRVFLGCLSSIWMYVIRDTVTGVKEERASPRPVRRGCVATPNPFRSSLALQCDAKSGRAGSVTVLSLSGSPVRTLSVPAGASRVLWDGRDNSGKEVSAGVYVVIPNWQPGERVRVVKTE